MFTRARVRPLTRPAVAIGTAALLMASPLTGSAAAKTKGKAPTVTLTKAQLKAVDALIAKDVKADEKPGPAGAAGAQGVQGVQGVPGTPGAQGAPGANGTATIAPGTIAGAGLTGSPASDIAPGTLGSTDFAAQSCPAFQLVYGFSGLAASGASPGSSSGSGLVCSLVHNGNLAPGAVEVGNLSPGVTTLTSTNGVSLTTGCSVISLTGTFHVSTWITSIVQPSAYNSHIFLIPDGPSTTANEIGVTACDLSTSTETIPSGTTFQALMIDAG